MKVCPICGAEGTLLQNTRKYTAEYMNQHVTKELNQYTCSCCGADLDLEFEENNEILMKEAYDTARKDKISSILAEIEKQCSFVELERSFALPPKTLSKWKKQSKNPSAAAAALVSLLSVFPWLSYVGMTNYNTDMAYKIAGTAFFKEMSKNPDNFPFALSNENYSAVGICHNKQTIYKEKLISSTCFGGDNYVN